MPDINFALGMCTLITMISLINAQTISNVTDAETCESRFGTKQCDTVFGIRMTTSSLSLGGNLFIIGFIVLHRTHLNFNQRLILWMSVAEICRTVSYFLGRGHATTIDAQCITQGFLMTWFDWASLLWTMVLTHAMMMALLYEKTAERYETWYHVVCWMTGLILSLIPLSTNAYGPSIVWCWVTKDHIDLRWGLWYGPAFFLVICLIIVNVYIFYVINQKTKQWQGTYTPEMEKHKKFLKAEVRPLKYYPAIALFCYAFPLANRIDDVIVGEKPFTLLVLHSTFSTIKGFFNALLFFAMTDQKVWSQCTVNGIKRALQQRRKGTVVNEYHMNGDDDDDGTGLQPGEYDDDDDDAEA
eukprot:m.67434 g.67434  ORF g.67434 m.67434 type:complete len:356 (-) comp23810_c0_seq1:28-1095(-)